MMNPTVKQLEQKWSSISLLSLVIAAFLGVLLRYKIAYSLPIVNQAHLLHGHSHFVMQNWVSLGLSMALVAILLANGQHRSYRLYYTLMGLCGLGMLVSFVINGYNLLSIIFASASLFVFYGFSWAFYKDLKKSNVSTIVKCFVATALAFYILASAGTLFMAFLMATKSMTPYWLKFCTYWFLHFQYNGWYTFAVIGMLIHWMKQTGCAPKSFRYNRFYYLMLIATVLGFVLSMIPFHKHAPAFIIGGVGLLCQVLAQVMLLVAILKDRKTIGAQLQSSVKALWILSLLAFVVKSLLQAMSLIPAMVEFAATFRPIIIGYLHLVFLVMISFFLIGIFIQTNYYKAKTGLQRFGLYTFVSGVLLNELLLTTQGLSFISYFIIGAMPQILLIVTIMMFVGIFIFYIAQSFERSVS